MGVSERPPSAYATPPPVDAQKQAEWNQHWEDVKAAQAAKRKLITKSSKAKQTESDAKQRMYDYLHARGYRVIWCESSGKYCDKDGVLRHQKHDFGGWADALAYNGVEVVGIQLTVKSQMATREAKIRANTNWMGTHKLPGWNCATRRTLIISCEGPEVVERWIA